MPAASPRSVPKHSDRIATGVRLDSGLWATVGGPLQEQGFMTVIIVSLALGSVTLGMLLGKLLKHASNIGTIEPPLELAVFQRKHYEDNDSPTSAAPRRTQLIPKSNEA
jgi:hypothetical protein